MADPQSSGTPPAKSNPNARYLFLLLIGLVLGIVGTVMTLQAIESGKSWRDHYPQATMHLLQAHSAQMTGKLKGNRCEVSDSLPHLQALRTLANDLEPAFPGLADDRRFAEHAAGMRATLDRALANPPAGCAALEEAASAVGESCRSCHVDFRT